MVSASLALLSLRTPTMRANRNAIPAVVLRTALDVAVGDLNHHLRPHHHGPAMFGGLERDQPIGHLAKSSSVSPLKVLPTSTKPPERWSRAAR